MLIIVTFNVRHTIPIFFTQAGSRKRTVYLDPYKIRYKRDVRRDSSVCNMHKISKVP